MIRGVTFDLEGTLIDVESVHHQAHLITAQEVGVSLTWTEAMEKLPHFVGGPDKLVAKEIYALSKKCKSVSEIIALKDLSFDQILSTIETITPRLKVTEVLTWLNQHEYPIAIGSVTPYSRGINLIYRSGLDQFFDPSKIVFKENVTKLKPSPDVYLETAVKLGISPREQLIFEDSVSGVKAGKSAGSSVIAIPTIKNCEFATRLLKAGAREIFYDWTEVNIENFVYFNNCREPKL